MNHGNVLFKRLDTKCIDKKRKVQHESTDAMNNSLNKIPTPVIRKTDVLSKQSLPTKNYLGLRTIASPFNSKFKVLSREVVITPKKKNSLFYDEVMDSSEEEEEEEEHGGEKNDNYKSNVEVIEIDSDTSAENERSDKCSRYSKQCKENRVSSTFHPNNKLIRAQLTSSDLQTARLRNDLIGGSGTGLGGVNIYSNPDNTPNQNRNINNHQSNNQSADHKKNGKITRKKSKTNKLTNRKRKSYHRGRRKMGSKGYAKGIKSNPNTVSQRSLSVSSCPMQSRGFHRHKSGSQPYMEVSRIDPNLGNIGGATIVYE